MKTIHIKHGFLLYSGRSPGGLTLAKVKQDGFSEENPVPVQHGHSVTVPGAAAAWVDTVQHFGSGKVRGLY